MKPYYSDYVNHMLRFYCRRNGTKPETFRSDIDRINWVACDKVVSKLSETHRIMLMIVFQSAPEELPEHIRQYSTANSIDDRTVWRTVNNISLRIAKERGLVGDGEWS